MRLVSAGIIDRGSPSCAGDQVPFPYRRTARSPRTRRDGRVRPAGVTSRDDADNGQGLLTEATSSAARPAPDAAEQVAHEGRVDDGHPSKLRIRADEPSASRDGNPHRIEVGGTDGSPGGRRIELTFTPHTHRRTQACRPASATASTPRQPERPAVSRFAATSSRNSCRVSPLNAPREYKSTATSWSTANPWSIVTRCCKLRVSNPAPTVRTTAIAICARTNARRPFGRGVVRCHPMRLSPDDRVSARGGGPVPTPTARPVSIWRPARRREPGHRGRSQPAAGYSPAPSRPGR